MESKAVGPDNDPDHLLAEEDEGSLTPPRSRRISIRAMDQAAPDLNSWRRRYPPSPPESLIKDPEHDASDAAEATTTTTSRSSSLAAGTSSSSGGDSDVTGISSSSSSCRTSVILFLFSFLFMTRSSSRLLSTFPSCRPVIFLFVPKGRRCQLAVGWRSADPCPRQSRPGGCRSSSSGTKRRLPFSRPNRRK